MFATAREAAGRSSDTIEVPDNATVATTVATVLGAACDRYGDQFSQVLATSRVWLNGEEPDGGGDAVVNAGDEVAVLPPVSGGAV